MARLGRVMEEGDGPLNKYSVALRGAGDNADMRFLDRIRIEIEVGTAHLSAGPSNAKLGGTL